MPGCCTMKTEPGLVYDPDISIWKLVGRWTGTLLPPIALTMLVSVGIALVMVVVVSWLDDGGPKWISATLQIIDISRTPISTFYAFSAAFAVSQAYSRWWGLRQAIMPIGGQDLAIQINAWVHEPIARSEMVRYMTLAHAFFIWQVRSFHESTKSVKLGGNEYTSRDELYAHLVNDGLMTPEERQVIEPCVNHFQIAYQFCLNTLSRARVKNALHANTDVQFMQNTISTMRGSCSKVMFTLGTPLPLAYFHAIGFMLSLVIMSTICGTVYEWRYVEPKGKWGSIWSPLISVAIQNGTLASLFHLLRILSNPFGDDCSDFPLEKLFEGGRKFAMQQLEFSAYDGNLGGEDKWDMWKSGSPSLNFPSAPAPSPPPIPSY